MEDQFEKFVKGNAEEFDSFDVPEGAWEAIQEQRKKESKPRARIVYLKTLRRIAAMLVLVLAGYGLFSIVSGPKKGAIAEQLPKEIREMDQYYEVQIANTWDELNRQHPGNELISQEVSVELEMLNEEKELLIEELKQNFSNQKVVEELIQIYRLRLEILEEVEAPAPYSKLMPGQFL